MTAAQKRYARYLYRSYRRDEICDVSRRFQRVCELCRNHPFAFAGTVSAPMTCREYAECWQAVWLAIATGQPLNDAMGAA